MNFGKRQLVLAALVVALGAAVYINWQFSDNKDLIYTNKVTSTKELGQAAYVNNEMSSVIADQQSSTESNINNTDSQSSEDSTDYFSKARINRQSARDEAIDTLKEILEGAKSSDQAKAEAVAQSAVLANNVEQEANIENLIIAKGFKDCVAFLQNGECSIVVNTTDGLLESEAILIKDIVAGQSGITYDKIKIVEVK